MKSEFKKAAWIFQQTRSAKRERCMVDNRPYRVLIFDDEDAIRKLLQVYFVIIFVYMPTLIFDKIRRSRRHSTRVIQGS